jgi:hypothetical protein
MNYNSVPRNRTARALQVLSKFGTADLAALGQLHEDLERAIPCLRYETDGPPMYEMDTSVEYSSIEDISALAAATSKVLGLITPLLGSTSSSTCLPQHSDALRCVISCTSICAGFMYVYPRLGSDGMRLVQARRCKWLWQQSRKVRCDSAAMPDAAFETHVMVQRVDLLGIAVDCLHPLFFCCVLCCSDLSV